MISAQLPILQVILPLIIAPISALSPSRKLAWLLAFIASLATFIVALLLSQQIVDSGFISYAVGGWEPPWGIELRLDAVNILLLLLVSGIATITLAFAPDSIAKEIPQESSGLFYAAYLLCLTGLLGIAITGDAFNLFVFLEVSSLSSYAMIAMGKDRRALSAAYSYLVMGTIGATFILIGIGLMYMVTGTLNMQDLAQRLPAVENRQTVHAAFAFLTVGISLKIALFPLHQWLPNAYAFAPSVVTVFLAATATKVALYVLLRFFFSVFGREYSFEELQLNYILFPLSIIAIFAATVVAIFQEDIKRMLAYSSVAQIGYMTLGISLATATGLTAGIVHIFNHALIKGGLFMVLACMVFRTGSCNLKDMAGLGRQMPWTMAAFVVGGLSLIGVPLTAGFISKWYLVQALLEDNLWYVAVMVLISSLLAVVYIWRVVEVVYFHDADANSARVSEAPINMLIVTWLFIGISLYFGINSSFSVGLADNAAQALLSGSQ